MSEPSENITNTGSGSRPTSVTATSVSVMPPRTDLSALGHASFIALTTFRHDGTPVSTPVWCVAQNEALLVFTEAQSGKVKRLHRDPHVTVARCTARGRPLGPALDATAEIIDGTEQVEALLADKYGWVWRGYTLLTAATRRLRQQPAPRTVTLRITSLGARTARTEPNPCRDHG